MKKNLLGLVVLIASTFFLTTTASALLIVNEGVSIQVVDGNGGGVEITGGILAADSPFTAGYYLNGGTAWQAFPFSAPGDIFANGDIFDLALRSDSGEYGLGLVVNMVFNEISIPGYDYYESVIAFWNIPTMDGIVPVSVTMSISDGIPPDGFTPAQGLSPNEQDIIAPIPEPATLLLLSSSVIGFIVSRKKSHLI